jgi:hypothetical protein
MSPFFSEGYRFLSVFDYKIINWDLAVSLFFVHFFPPAERNEPKKRRLRERGVLF